jgi:hypothetical protein
LVLRKKEILLVECKFWNEKMQSLIVYRIDLKDQNQLWNQAGAREGAWNYTTFAAKIN